jgi:hypothetical protein
MDDKLLGGHYVCRQKERKGYPIAGIGGHAGPVKGRF